MSEAECRVQTDRSQTHRQETTMNTNLNTTTILQGLTAAAVALVLTWACLLYTSPSPRD